MVNFSPYRVISIRDRNSHPHVHAGQISILNPVYSGVSWCLHGLYMFQLMASRVQTCELVPMLRYNPGQDAFSHCGSSKRGPYIPRP